MSSILYTPKPASISYNLNRTETNSFSLFYHFDITFEYDVLSIYLQQIMCVISSSSPIRITINLLCTPSASYDVEIAPTTYA